MLDVQIRDLVVGNDRPLAVIAGPCQLETRDHALMIAEAMARFCAAAGAGYVFKASYDKANRTSLSGRRGLGMEEGLRILQDVRDAVGCPTLTDVHDAGQCAPAAEVVGLQGQLLEGAHERASPPRRAAGRRAPGAGQPAQHDRVRHDA